jgi:uncharacterized protein YegP (UPF0339 family)
MTERSFPSYRLFRDNRKRWRWRYDLRNGETIAVSSDSYSSREECERMVGALRSSLDAPVWISRIDLANG